MGRKILLGENPSIHPILSLSLLIASMAAIVALISSLCITRKKSPPSRDSQPKTTENLDVDSPPQNEATPQPTLTKATETTREPPSATVVVESEDTKERAAEEPLPLPPPPGMSHLREARAASYHYRSSSSVSSHRKIMASMSMRVQGGGMASRQQSRREEKRDKKLKHEDSIWKKRIILGEKCRVPEEEDDTILYDDKGNRISAYHPKAPNSLPVSRQTSFIDHDAIPSSAGQK